MSHEPAEHSMDTTPQKPSEDGQPGSLRSGDLFGVLSQVLHDAENGKTGAHLADYAPHIRELMADKSRLDWLEKARPIVWALEHEGCAPYWIVTDFDGKHEETPEFSTCRSAIDEALSLSSQNTKIRGGEHQAPPSP